MTTLKEKWGIDSNLIIYALGNDQDFSFKTKEFFKSIEQNNIDLYITHQNILEVQNVLKRVYKLKYSESLKILLDFIRVLGIRIVNPLPQTIDIYTRLMIGIDTSLDHYDLYLAATFLTYDIKYIYTNNSSDFKKIKSIKAINPIN